MQKPLEDVLDVVLSGTTVLFRAYGEYDMSHMSQMWPKLGGLKCEHALAQNTGWSTPYADDMCSIGCRPLVNLFQQSIFVASIAHWMNALHFRVMLCC